MSIEQQVDCGVEGQVVISYAEKILGCPLFRSSKRCQTFFRYVVEKHIDGVRDLKERTIGVEAFGRAPDYDTNLDPIVRVTAVEVRKRIAQYYFEIGQDDGVQIYLHAGSYLPSISRTGQAPATAIDAGTSSPKPEELVPAAGSLPDPALPEEVLTIQSVRLHSSNAQAGGSRKFRSALVLFAALLLLGFVAAFAYLTYSRRSSVQQAWKGFVVGSKPVLICIGEPSLVRHAGQTEASRLDSDSKDISVREHMHSGDYVVFSDVQALTGILKQLDTMNRNYTLQVARTTTFSDMREISTILVGGNDNPWTMRALQSMRFRFVHDGDVSWIQDVHDPANHRWSVYALENYSDLSVDYAIIGIFTDSSTQQPVMIVAGVGENGTKAASEFMTSQSGIAQLLKARPDHKQNFEAVLTTQVINGISGPPHVLAVEYW